MSEGSKEDTMYFFSSRELSRLAVYRAAVIARFYTDQCEPPVRSREVSRFFHQPTTAVPTGDDTIRGDMKAPNQQNDSGSGC